MRVEGLHHARTAKPGGLGIDGRNQRAVAEMDAVEIADGGDRTMHGRRETRGGSQDTHDDGPAHSPSLLGFARSEEHTSELQSLMRISYAVFCLNKKTNRIQSNT